MKEVQVRLRVPEDSWIEGKTGHINGTGVWVRDAHLSTKDGFVPFCASVFIPYTNVAYLVRTEQVTEDAEV